MVKKQNSNIPGSNSAGFLDAVLSATVFAGWLVEPSLHKPLPVFVKVPVRDHIVALTHLGATRAQRRTC